MAWPRVVSQRLLSGCWPWAAQGMLGLGAAQKVWQLQQHAMVMEGWAPNSRCGGSSPTAWSSSSGEAAGRNTPSLACWSGGSASIQAAALARAEEELHRSEGLTHTSPSHTVCLPQPPHPANDTYISPKGPRTQIIGLQDPNITL